MPRPGDTSRPRAPFGQDFRRYFFSQVVSQMGTSFTFFALPLIVFKLTGSPTNLALTAVASFVPYLLFGLVLGAVVDQVDRRRMMIAVDLARAALIAALPVLSIVDMLHVEHIYVVAFLLGDIRRRYGEIRYDSGAWRGPVESSELFGPLVEERFAYQHVLEPEGVVELMASTSFIAALPKEENRAVRHEIAQLLASHPETRGEHRLVVPYRTDAYWTSTPVPGTE